MTLLPIETRYNGFRFRSRLEARWAVVFDKAVITYEYEPEGFKLDTGGYLPDFYLPEWGIYAEVKPDRAPNPDEAMKLRAFSQHKRLLLILGSPGSHAMFMLAGGAAIGEVRVVPSPLGGWSLVYTKRNEGDRMWEEALEAGRAARFEHGESGDA